MARHQRSSSAPCTFSRQNSVRTLVKSDDDDGDTVIESLEDPIPFDVPEPEKKKKHITDIEWVASKESQRFSDDRLCSGYQPSDAQTRPREPYSVFSTAKIRWIVFLVSIAAFFAPFSVNSYFPAMNLIEMEFSITSAQVNLSVTVFMIFQAISPSFWSGIADTKGRRPVYVLTLFIFMIACVGLAMAKSYVGLLLFRMLQAFGASSVIAIGAGVIADVAHPSQRGEYIGWYSLGWNLGPVVGPAMGGFVSKFIGWRWIFWILAILSGVHWLLIGFGLPETLRALVGNGSGYANPTPFQWWCSAKAKNNNPSTRISSSSRSLRLSSFLAPFLCIKEKDVLTLLVHYSAQYAACYTVSTSIPFVLSHRYGLDEMLIGFCYIPMGIGCVAGSVFQGKMLNRNYDAFRARFSVISFDPSQVEIPIEQARLRTVWVHALVFNLLLVVYGWCLYIKAPLGSVLAIHFVLGFTSQAIFNCIQTLLVDLFPSQSAGVTASNNIFRCIFGAGATTAIIPLLQLFDVGWAFTLVSILLLISRLLLYIELKFGSQWRSERTQRLQ
ncbi:major facilitator superfamily domain-containing protein [Dichotomocladium elegans]|nr:major facilitator superfamily domain-containing protein [Dichotomocladium elegans]